MKIYGDLRSGNASKVRCITCYSLRYDLSAEDRHVS
jgi:hypothetical protein